MLFNVSLCKIPFIGTRLDKWSLVELLALEHFNISGAAYSALILLNNNFKKSTLTVSSPTRVPNEPKPQ